MKNRDVAVYLLCSVLILIVGGFATLVYIYNRDITTYSSNFSELKFSTVTIGTPADRVHQLLGKPLKTQHVTPFEIWEYGETVKETKTLTGSQLTFGKGLSVRFNSEGLVVHAQGTTASDLIPGMRREKVSAIKGIPDNVHVSRSVILQYFSLPNGSLGKYQERTIGVDKDGRISEVITRTIDYD